MKTFFFIVMFVIPYVAQQYLQSYWIIILCNMMCLFSIFMIMALELN